MVSGFWELGVVPGRYRQENRRTSRSVDSGNSGWFQGGTGKKTEERHGKYRDISGVFSLHRKQGKGK
ncbi:hypothetical protein NDU88_003050 [Pleurodeles waltl]|uniref:Uncharacterized protein n=1 Tax=Pleurodeles waltl TaxID=8319 RepID=A0AAV7T4L6_PLEWA|nr:hypothetical protein NDU88_003050 [Pleurodeles waltl]